MVQLTAVPTDPAALRAVFALVPQGVVALCGADEAGRPIGMTASSFTPISLAPPLVSVAVARTSSTWPLLRSLPEVGVSLLAESQAAACRQLAARIGDRFDGLDWCVEGESGIYLNDTVARLECRLYDEVDAGDHNIVLFEITSVDVGADRDPLIFHGSDFRRLAADVAQPA